MAIKQTHTSTYVPDLSMLNDLAKGGVAEWIVETDEDEYLILAEAVDADAIRIVVTRRNPAGHLDLIFQLTGTWWAAILARYGAEAHGKVRAHDDWLEQWLSRNVDLVEHAMAPGSVTVERG